LTVHFMSRLRFLVVDGNIATARELHRTTYGHSPGESYSQVVMQLSPDAICDVALPADQGANLPDSAGLEDYDAVFLTGSALNIYKVQPEVTRQIELMRSVYASGTPCFGSCWGIQMGVTAAGGTVHLNPKGREVGFARRIAPNQLGATHPLLAGRPAAFDAPAIHEDEIILPPDGDWTLLASNAMSAYQAIDITWGGGQFWGVQYHPEFSLKELATILRRRRDTLVGEGYFTDAASGDAILADWDALHDAPSRKDLAWKHGLDHEVLDQSRRLTEIRNFIQHKALPHKSLRGRA
jgi:GMP synthase (glutamine-hydrolysing)